MPAPLVGKLPTGRNYRFQLVGENENGEGPRSGIYTFVTSEKPNPPINVAWASSTEETIEITWSAPLPKYTGEPEGRIVRYEVFWNDQDTNSPIVVLTTSPAFKRASPAVPLTAGNMYR